MIHSNAIANREERRLRDTPYPTATTLDRVALTNPFASRVTLTLSPRGRLICMIHFLVTRVRSPTRWRGRRSVGRGRRSGSGVGGRALSRKFSGWREAEHETGSKVIQRAASAEISGAERKREEERGRWRQKAAGYPSTRTDLHR